MFSRGRPTKALETPPACPLAPGACSLVLFKWPPPASLLRTGEGFPCSHNLCGLPSSCFLSLFLLWTQSCFFFWIKPSAQPSQPCSRSSGQADRQPDTPRMGGECGPHLRPTWLLGPMVILLLPDVYRGRGPMVTLHPEKFFVGLLPADPVLSQDDSCVQRALRQCDHHGGRVGGWRRRPPQGRGGVSAQSRLQVFPRGQQGSKMSP